MSKRKRHLRIREIISKNEVETQDDLVALLRKEGFNVTQATVSRDIKELSLIKVPLKDGRYTYSLTVDHLTPEQIWICILQHINKTLNYVRGLLLLFTYNQDGIISADIAHDVIPI